MASSVAAMTQIHNWKISQWREFSLERMTAIPDSFKSALILRIIKRTNVLSGWHVGLLGGWIRLRLWKNNRQGPEQQLHLLECECIYWNEVFLSNERARGSQAC